MKPKYKTNKLVVIVDALGDCIAATPAINAFKSDFPDIDLYVITWQQHSCADVFKDNPNIKQVLSFDGSFESQYQYAKQIGFLPPEIVVMDNIVNFAQFCQKCKTSVIDKWIQVLFCLKCNLVDIYSLNLLGRTLSDDEKIPKLYTQNVKCDIDFADLSPFIVVNYSSRTDVDRKNWPLSKWHAVLNLILSNFPTLKIVTVGSPDSTIIPFNNNRVINYRSLSIHDVLFAIQQSIYTITPQSGIAWLADCVPDVPGLQINVGAPKEVVGRISPKCIIVDQKELFGGHTISINDVWDTLYRELGYAISTYLPK
jgi:hypothetical protein